MPVSRYIRTSTYPYSSDLIVNATFPMEIASAIDSPGHNLMKAFSEILQPLVGRNKTWVKDGYHSIDILRSGIFRRKKGFMVSLDVKALFPSLPLPEALNILEPRISSWNNLHSKTDLTPLELMHLVRLASSEPWFECELGTYVQKHGAPMGGPLSCLLADIYMEEYEKRICFKLGSYRIRAEWLRYRDDTWLIWEHSKSDLDDFITYLNSLDNNIQWTFELEKEGTIPFLDVLVKREKSMEISRHLYTENPHIPTDIFTSLLTIPSHKSSLA
jgi:hypothetical protein